MAWRSAISSLTLGLVWASIGLPNALLAQDGTSAVPTEAHAWLGASASFWLHKDWNADFQVQLRTDGDALRFRQCFAEGQLEYELSKHGRLAGEYRFGFQRRDGFRQRVALAVGTRFWKSGDWTLSGRSKTQCGWSWENPAAAQWRNKLQLSHKLNKRWDLQAEAELWSSVWPFWAVADQTRWSLEASWDRKDHDIALGYAFGRSLGMQEPSTEHIFSLRYRFGSIRLPWFSTKSSS